jgi:hypothetical protein
MRIRIGGRHRRRSSPIGMILFGVIGAVFCFTAAASDAGPAPRTSRVLDPTNTWGPVLMGVLLLMVAAVGVYLLVQQIRGLSNLAGSDDLGRRAPRSIRRCPMPAARIARRGKTRPCRFAYTPHRLHFGLTRAPSGSLAACLQAARRGA